MAQWQAKVKKVPLKWTELWLCSQAVPRVTIDHLELCAEIEELDA